MAAVTPEREEVRARMAKKKAAKKTKKKGK